MTRPPVLAHAHIPKTGGSTLRHVLRSSLGIRHCDVWRPRREPFGEEDLALARRAHPFGLWSISGHGLLRPSAHLPAEEVLCFTFLREPVARLLSAYQHHVRSRRRIREGRPVKSIERFLRHRTSTNRQVQFLSGGQDLEAAKRELERMFFVGLVERFDESLAGLALLSPHPLAARSAARNVSQGDGAKQAVLADPGLARRVVDANALDLELYAFARDVLYPAQRLRVEEARHAARRAAPRGALEGRVRARLSRSWNLLVYRRMARRARGRAGAGGA